MCCLATRGYSIVTTHLTHISAHVTRRKCNFLGLITTAFPIWDHWSSTNLMSCVTLVVNRCHSVGGCEWDSSGWCIKLGRHHVVNHRNHPGKLDEMAASCSICYFLPQSPHSSLQPWPASLRRQIYDRLAQYAAPKCGHVRVYT